jgi:adenosylcobinamide-GDP ribazoletransferase
MLGVLFVMQFAAVYAVIEKGNCLILLIIITVISRCCAAMSILCLKTMAQSGYAYMYRQNTAVSHKIILILLAVSTAAAAFILTGICGLVVAGAVIAGFIGAMAYVYKEFKGVSGDLAGYALVISELCGLIALAVI